MSARRRDSAGIEIVEYADISKLPVAFRLAPAPFVQVGGLQSDPATELDSRHPWLSATLLTDGRIVVPDFSRLMFYDQTGRFLRAVGRRGQGPGEFTQIREICQLQGDTLLVVDYSDGRVTVWTPQGEHVRTYPRPGFIPIGGCFSDGSVIVQRPPEDASVGRDGVPHDRIRLNGSLVSRLGRFPLGVFLPVLPREISLVVSSASIYFGDPAKYEIQILRLDGAPRRIIRVNSPLKPLTAASLRRDLERTMPSGLSRDQRNRRVSAMMPIDLPTTYPVFRRVRGDIRGRIWVQSFDPRTQWTVFDSTGRVLGTVEVPARKAADVANPMLVGFGADYVVILSYDPDGAAHLEFRRLLPGS
jgi:hypothetical protein